jgi:GNAT superfamily N-acetyltransferase
MGELSRPRKLERSDVRKDFCSGATELDEWLIKYAWQNQKAHNSTTYVTHSDSRVVGYYAIAAAAYARTATPSQVAKQSPEQIPCILLARLAVDREFQGRKLGAALLRDALQRAGFLSASLGAKAVLVHARDQAAMDFYLANGDFIQSPVEPLHLFAPMEAILKHFGGQATQA